MALLCFTTLGSLTHGCIVLVSPLMTTDHQGPLHCRHLSQSLGSHNLIIVCHKHYKDSSRITIIIQTHLEIQPQQQSIVDDPMKVNCQFPLGPSAESPPNYSRATSWEPDSAAAAALHHRSRSWSIAHIPRIARIQYGDRNLLGWWHHQTSKHNKYQRYIKLKQKVSNLFVWFPRWYLHCTVSLSKFVAGVIPVFVSSRHQIAVARSPGHRGPSALSQSVTSYNRDQGLQGWEFWTKRPLMSDKDLSDAACQGPGCVRWSLFTLCPQHSTKGPLIAHVYVTECLIVSLPQCQHLDWYHHVIQQLSSWAELSIIMFVTIWQFASEPVITNIIVSTRMSPSPCALCQSK